MDDAHRNQSDGIERAQRKPLFARAEEGFQTAIAHMELMDYDRDKVDEAVLALLWLTTTQERGFKKTWKGQDWDVMERLHAKGFIGDPKGRAKSVPLTDEGARRSEELFRQLFKP